MDDVVTEARAASRADAWRHIEPLVAEVERLRKENTRLTNRNIVLEALGAAAEQTHDEWELLRSVVAGVEALAEEWDSLAADLYIMAEDILAVTYEDLSRRLRSVLSDTRQEEAQ